MRKRKNQAIALCVAALLLCAAVTAAYTAVFIWSDDVRPPVISMDADSLEVSVSAADEELLAGVTAMDARDGDVTASLLVQGVSDLTDGAVTVTYAAFDSAGNVAKASRTLRYTDYTGPRFRLNGALVFNSGTSMDVLGRVGATDLIDGDISRQTKADLVSDTGSLSYPGVHQVQFRVTNSLGDTRYLTLPVDVLTAGDYNASVVLSNYLVYLPRGAEFSARDYLEGLTTGLGDEIPVSDPEMQVSIESNVRTGVPGVYSVRYTVSYSSGLAKYVGYTRLNVVVEE